jgi:hypothetical protein
MGKKGKSGSVRKEINSQRASNVVKSKPDDTEFGRVTKLLGYNHVMAAIPTATGSIELRVRIPNLFHRKGATPITTRDIVSVYVGVDFDHTAVKPTDQFDITAILSNKQAHELSTAGVVPRWMVHEEVASGGGAHDTAAETGWEFSYSESKGAEGSDVDNDGAAPAAPAAAKKNAIIFVGGDDDKGMAIDVDAI